jgi:UDPglucose 6-dehydrogenase
MANARAYLGDKHIEYCAQMYDALRGAHALVICTEWQEFRSPDFERMKSLLAHPAIFDGRNLYDLDWMRQSGMAYFSIGRPAVLLANKDTAQ